MLAIVARVSIGNAPHRIAEHFDEGVDHAGISEQLGDVQHEVGCGHALGWTPDKRSPTTRGVVTQRAVAEHRGLCLDAANAPAKHA